MSVERTAPGGDDAIALLREIDGHRTSAPALAQPADRFIARMIDIAVMVALFIGVSFVLYELIAEPVYDAPFTEERYDQNKAESRLSAGAGGVAALVFMVVVEVVLRGRGPGKRLLHLRIVNAADDGEVSPGRASLRLALWAIPVIGTLGWWLAFFGTPVGLLGMTAFVVTSTTVALPIFRGNDRRAFHDRAAHTKVTANRY